MILAAAALAAALWSAHPSDGVEMRLTREDDANRLDFDFHGHGGYAIARRQVDLQLPPNYQFTFRVRGEAPPENLEFKLGSGDDVWWLNRRDFVFPHAWTELKSKKRQIAFAWGPAGGGEIRHVEAMEVVVTAGSGGKGTVWFTDPILEELPAVTHEIGGLIIDCAHCSVPGALQQRVGERLFVWLPDAPTELPRIVGETRNVSPQPPSWAPSENDFWSIVAKSSRRGDYPRYLIGEQSYWTVLGADGADEEALVGEDGAVEPFKGSYAIEPFLRVRGKRLTWADVTITQSLMDGYLPIPTVTWKSKEATMTVTAAVSSSSMLQLRYRVKGPATLELAYRNFQVNPSTQFLNGAGGVSVRKTRERTIHATQLNIPLRKGARVEPLAAIAKSWREKLNRVRIETADRAIDDTIRANLAYTLIERDGAAFKPGARSYDRSWIRDGSLIAAVLLRLGHAAEAKAFARWFAKYQYANGKVPCCVDSRGADPVPENDSHGEFIYLVAEVGRLTHDAAFAKEMAPHVAAAARYIEELRRANHGEFEGLVTESISHEGYSAKPVHSYWDDFFALKGLEEAGVQSSMRADLAASLRRTIAAKKIDYVPGSVELGDFDPTSTAIAVSPLGFLPLLPERELRRTYERYFAAIARPREDYTPYEMRNIGALVRMGERDRAAALVDRFLLDRRPAGWKLWAEVVGTDYRKPRFIGDMPHAWVASDFIRSILEAIAYDREDGVLVIGAGVPQRWLPLHVGPLPTYQGTVDVSIDRDGVVDVAGNVRRMELAAPFRLRRRTGASSPR